MDRKERKKNGENIIKTEKNRIKGRKKGITEERYRKAKIINGKIKEG